MAESSAKPVGSLLWFDLTVDNADQVRDFYSAVVGWTSSPISMGDYDDYAMLAPETGDGVSGVCHARGENAAQPPYWIAYIAVADLDASVSACTERGGSVVGAIRDMGGVRFCVIRDPAGAYLGLMQQA